MIKVINRFLKILLVCFLLIGCSEDKQDNNESQVIKVIEKIDAEAIYNANCLPCHAEGPGHPGTMRLAIRAGEDKAVLTKRSDLQAEYVKTIVRQGILLMPPFRPAEITDSELDALASYLAREKG